MAKPISSVGLVLVLFGSVLATTALPAQEAGEAIRIHTPHSEDVYAAGGTVDVLADVDGDVVVAGGRVSVGAHVNGDVMAAGGTVAVRAQVVDDVRVAGGDITLAGSIGDDAIAAGGNLVLAPDARVGGRAWFSGGRIDVAGTVGKELRAAGGRIILSGRVEGNVELAGRDIRILDSAVIIGDLVYRSPAEAEIASGAQIKGSVSYHPVEQPVVQVVAAVTGIGIVLVLSLIVVGVVGFLFFPGFVGSAMRTLRAEPWKCLGLGLAVFAATPVVIGVLVSTVVGALLGIVLGALYLILLLAGLLTGAFFVGDLAMGRKGGGEVGRGKRLLSFVLALILILLLGLIPLLGALLLLIVTFLGMGVLKLTLYRQYAKA